MNQNNPNLYARGREIAARLACSDERVAHYRDCLLALDALQHPDDPFIWYSCLLALKSADEGNHGVGAVIVHGGRIVAEGRNRAFIPRFRTDLHAEMDAVNQLEMAEDPAPPEACTLYSSLECCSMCTTRLINSGLGKVIYAAEDDDCGMIRRLGDMPPGYRRMAENRTPPQVFAKSECQARLVEIARDIFAINLIRLDEKVLRRKQ